MNEISLAEYRQQIEGAIEDGCYEEAVAHVRQILQAYPKDIGTYWLLGKVMLEAGHEDHAVDVLRRVGSADPEHRGVWLKMSEIARQRGEPEVAVWYLERAFELATDDEGVARELRHLYGELRGGEPAQLQLTQSAMARLYLRGNLLTRAISELRQMLEEHPDRLDLRVALAEALWRDGQRVQAAEVCQEILDAQPHNLKANLILGEIWTTGGRAEGELYLEQARALDPENHMASEVFGLASPLPLESPLIAPLDYAATPEDEWPAWPDDGAPSSAPEPFALSDTGEVVEAQVAIPAWLHEMTGQVAPEAPLAAAPPAGMLDEMMGGEEAAVEEIPEEEVLDWLRQLESQDESVLPEAPEEEIPAWLADTEPPAGEAALEGGEAMPGQEPVDIPEWLLNLTPAEAEPPAERMAKLTEQPRRLERQEIPGRDEALAWLQQLVEGEEEAIAAGAEAEAKAAAKAETEVEGLLEPVAAPEGPEGVGQLAAGPPREDMPSAEEALSWLEGLVERAEVERPPEAPAPPAAAALEPGAEEVEEARARDEAPLAEAMEEPPVEDLVGYIAERRAYAEEHADDHEAWLDLGRVLWQADRHAKAIETYDHLIASGKLLDEVIPDLEDYVRQWPDVDVQRALGDAYMRADRLADALDIYRRTLAGL